MAVLPASSLPDCKVGLCRFRLPPLSGSPSTDACNQSGEQASAQGKTFDVDVLIQGVLTASADTEPIKRCDAHRASKIRVGSSPRHLVPDRKADRARELTRRFIQRKRSGVRLPNGPRYTPRDCESDIIRRRGKRQDALYAVIEIGLTLGHAQRLAAARHGHAVHPFSAVHDTDAEGAALRRHGLDLENLACHGADGRTSLCKAQSCMAGPAERLEIEARDRVASGDNTA